MSYLVVVKTFFENLTPLTVSIVSGVFALILLFFLIYERGYQSAEIDMINGSTEAIKEAIKNAENTHKRDLDAIIDGLRTE